VKVKQPFSAIKNEVIKVYNSVNQELFGIGVKSQKLEILGDKILIFATHKRIPAMKSLDESNRALTIQVDRAVTELNKLHLKAQIEPIVGVPIKVILKDYDPFTEAAATIIIFEEELEE
jgi:uncharacterized protein YbcI